MISLSTILHLRIPFSFFLLPVFLFSLALSPNVTMSALLWSFLIIHFLLYPASNGYNSYFDKDEKSIGGLKNPPPVDKSLYYVSLLFDAIAVVLGFVLINVDFAVMLLVYGLISKAYSHPMVRLKKYAITAWLVTGIFQGLFTFMMCYVGINGFDLATALQPKVIYGGLLSTLMLWANYPMTQIYQHEEDAKHGDNTISRKLGIRGTFYFTGGIFMVVTAGFVLYLQHYFALRYSLLFLAALAPVVLFFTWWFFKVLRDESKADYAHTMWLNFTSATSLNIYFFYLFTDYTKILEAL